MATRFASNLFAKILFAAACLISIGAEHAAAFSYDSDENAYVCNGTQSDIQAAINDAAANHPATSFANAATVRMTGPGVATVALGINNTPLKFGTCVILTGNGNSGADMTTVTLPSSWTGNSTTSNTNAVIQISNGAWVENFAIPSALSGTPPFSVSNGTTGARITGIAYNTRETTNCAYFCVVACSSSQLSQVTIDDNIIVPASGTNELILTRGPIDAWQKPDSWGSPNQVYIETNQFGLPGGNTGGYVCDFNSNTIGTVRFNTIYGPIKIDGHGAATNTPTRGVRQMEIYGNAFLSKQSFFQAMEIRGGTSRNFLNYAANSAITNPVGSDYITYDEYGCLNQSGAFNGVWQTPSNYPILDQVGEGQDLNGSQAPGGSDPAYMWLNRITVGPGAGTTSSWQPGSKSILGNSPGGTFQADSNEYAEGATTIGLITQSYALSAGTFSDAHGTWQNAVAIASDNTRYLIGSTTSANQKQLIIDSQGLNQAIASGSSPIIACNAFTNWQKQTGNPTNTFNIASYVPGTPKTIILANRDIFSQTPAQWGNGSTGGYDGTQGVNYGPTAEMNRSSPIQKGVGWWVTDQGSWNLSLPPNTSGQLYVWNGSAWTLNYTPYQYPYYQPVFTMQPVSVNVAGGTVALNAEASNSPKYQWYLNGSTPVPGATDRILVLDYPAFSSGSYTCVAINSAGTATSAAATLSLVDSSDVGRLLNLSCRANVGSNSLVAGFAIGGKNASGSEPLLLRGSGPALAAFGVPDVLPDPILALYSGTSQIGENNGWEEMPRLRMQPGLSALSLGAILLAMTPQYWTLLAPGRTRSR